MSEHNSSKTGVSFVARPGPVLASGLQPDNTSRTKNFGLVEGMQFVMACEMFPPR